MRSGAFRVFQSTLLAILIAIFINQQQQKLFVMSFSNINADEHVSRKVNTFKFYKEGSQRFFFKIKQNGGFSFKVRLFYLFFTFGQGSLNP